MNPSKATLAVYGIQDVSNQSYPFNVHDHALVRFYKGKITNFIQLERITRIKYDNKMPDHLLSVLNKLGLMDPETYDIVFVDNVLGRSFISRKGNLRFEGPLHDNLALEPEKGKCWWINGEKDAWVLNHELAHLFSCIPFYGMFRDNSLLIHYDGGASKSNFSAWYYTKGRLQLLEFHWDTKWLTSLFNANALTFSLVGGSMKNQNAVPGKLMGLAAYGNYNKKMENWLKKNDWFENCWATKKLFFEKLKKDWGVSVKSVDLNQQVFRDITATVQRVFITGSFSLIQKLQLQTGASNLYYSGGCALNLELNSLLATSGLFDEVFIPPCANDSGLAIGAGACLELVKHGNVELHSPYLNNLGIEDYNVLLNRVELEKIAECLAGNKIIGVVNGYGEAGPRALGNRSIIARADDKNLAKKLSVVFKGREWYRPVAPVMLLENAAWFTGIDNLPVASKYMLYSFTITKAKQKELAGAVHADNTSRIQVISNKQDNPFLFELLSLMDEKYGVKALLNTSFNCKGKPMVHSREDAVQAAKQMKLDGLVVNGEFTVF
jgi:carbamoyltransferase